MRDIPIILVIFVLILSASAQEDVHPFYYMTYADGQYDTAVMDLNTGDTLFTVSSDGNDCVSYLSPDGQYLHYATWDDNIFESQGYIVETISGDVREIPNLERNGFWSPDGLRLAFKAPILERNPMLYVYDIITDETTEIALVNRDTLVQWQGDDLLFISQEENLLDIQRWTDGNILPIQLDYQMQESSRYRLSLSPDGEMLLIGIRIRETNNGLGIWQYDLMSVESGEILQSHMDLSPLQQIVRWHPNSLQFAYFADRTKLMLYDVVANTATLLARAAGDYPEPFTLRWSPDEQFLSFNQIANNTMTNFYPQSNLTVYDFAVGDISYVDGGITYHDSGNMRWLTDTQLIYTDSSADLPHTAEDDNLNELVLYDVITEERTILTDTPNLDEAIFCRSG